MSSGKAEILELNAEIKNPYKLKLFFYIILMFELILYLVWVLVTVDLLCVHNLVWTQWNAKGRREKLKPKMAGV